MLLIGARGGKRERYLKSNEKLGFGKSRIADWIEWSYASYVVWNLFGEYI
jgi:hypothetical protein